MNVKRYRDDKGNVWDTVRADHDEVEFRSPIGGPGLVMLADHLNHLIDQGFWVELPAGVSLDRERLMKMWKNLVGKPEVTACTCDIHLLMRSGCQCGGFAAEQASKQQ